MVWGNPARAQDRPARAPVSTEAARPVTEVPSAREPVVIPPPGELPNAAAVPVTAGPESATAAPPQEPPPVRKPSAGQAQEQTDATKKRYVIGSLDVLYIRVWNNQNLTGVVDVRPDGMISLPLVGELKADGLTVAELKDVIKVHLSDYLNSPEVDVQVSRINSKKVFLVGAINRPGPLVLASRLTVSEAIFSAGGFRDFANQKKIYVLRGTKKFNFNYKEVILGKHLEQDIPLENGDKIIVPE